MKLFEIRTAAYKAAKRKFPNMPDYVVKDLVYAAVKEEPEVLTGNDWKDYYGDLRWEKEKLFITIDVFNQQTQEHLRLRAGGKSNPYNVRNDAERHETQKRMIASGPSQEPIIVIHTPDGYELQEGFHRTIQSLQKWPQGYEQIAWVGYK
jgi:hypothetical protein